LAFAIPLREKILELWRFTISSKTFFTLTSSDLACLVANFACRYRVADSGVFVATLSIRASSSAATKDIWLAVAVHYV